ncbi:MAG: phosphatase PAP2 family protein, partial [Spirochaetales bacterium]|nr:phosphatase PAP2 family protein [Candidatus Physcosoma equi]
MKKRILTLLFVSIFALSSVFASVPRDRSEVNALDRAFIHPYNKTLDKAATLTDLAFFTSPAVLAMNMDIHESFKIGMMYAETLGAAFLGKEILKCTIERPRPYLYTDTVDTDEEEWMESFPSGHTTGAFAVASFTSYVFSQYYPDSKWKVPVALLSYGIAATEGLIRIQSGCHFPTDVLMGAALGTAIGIGIPML